MTSEELLKGLPGEALLSAGREDFLAGRHTIPALLVAIARTRLHRAGFVPDDAPPTTGVAELELYRALRHEGGDAYSRYNALLRELTSFESALEHRIRRRAEAAT